MAEVSPEQDETLVPGETRGSSGDVLARKSDVYNRSEGNISKYRNMCIYKYTMGVTLTHWPKQMKHIQCACMLCVHGMQRVA